MGITDRSRASSFRWPGSNPCHTARLLCDFGGLCNFSVSVASSTKKRIDPHISQLSAWEIVSCAH